MKPEPDPRSEDARAFRIIFLWLLGCIAIAALYLVFSIWIDWK